MGNDATMRIEVPEATIAPSRPVVRWLGGKWRTAPFIIDQFPDHEVYVEPYGGAASVLMQKERSRVEVYNDLDDQIVNLFRVLRGSRASELVEAIRLTPYAVGEYLESYEDCNEPVEMARRLVIRCTMGRGVDSSLRRTGFRGINQGSRTAPAREWANYPDALSRVVDRMIGVAVERRPAFDVVRSYDGPDTLFYVDPPYLPDLRNNEVRYSVDADDAHHLEMLEVLGRARGMVVLSGYPNDLYDRVLRGWRTVDSPATIDGGQSRVERLWINPAATRRVIAPAPAPNRQIDLFGA